MEKSQNNYWTNEPCSYVAHEFVQQLFSELDSTGVRDKVPRPRSHPTWREFLIQAFIDLWTDLTDAACRRVCRLTGRMFDTQWQLRYSCQETQTLCESRFRWSLEHFKVQQLYFKSAAIFRCWDFSVDLFAYLRAVKQQNSRIHFHFYSPINERTLNSTVWFAGRVWASEGCMLSHSPIDFLPFIWSWVCDGGRFSKVVQTHPYSFVPLSAINYSQAPLTETPAFSSCLVLNVLAPEFNRVF